MKDFTLNKLIGIYFNIVFILSVLYKFIFLSSKLKLSIKLHYSKEMFNKKYFNCTVFTHLISKLDNSIFM